MSANTTYYIQIKQYGEYENIDYKFSLSYKVSKPNAAKTENVKLKASKKKLKLTWSSVSKAKGYQVQYSTKSCFKNAKTKTLSKSKRSCTIKNLKTKKKYYVRVRAYKTYKNKYGKTVRTYGKWVTVSRKTK